MTWLNSQSVQLMHKSKKTGWEKKMRRWQITLVIVVPLVFGLVFWLVAHHSANSR
jgi:hypothetical protein